MPVVTAPQTLLGIRSSDDALATGASVDENIIRRNSEDSLPNSFAKQVRPIFQSFNHTGIVLASPSLPQRFRHSLAGCVCLLLGSDGFIRKRFYVGQQVAVVVPDIAGQFNIVIVVIGSVIHGRDFLQLISGRGGSSFPQNRRSRNQQSQVCRSSSRIDQLSRPASFHTSLPSQPAKITTQQAKSYMDNLRQ